MDPTEEGRESEEPLLKYQRIGGHFHAIFKDDSLSCIALHVQFLCVGTYNGNVLLLELDGRFLRRLHQHYKKVNHVCIDETGQYIASCSDDGTVAVYTLFPPSTGNAMVSVASTGGEVNIYNYFSAIYCVQLEDHYAMKRERSFACGGIAGQLILNKKGWIIDKENTIHEGEGPVHAIQWKQGLVAWANDWGVKVYDTERDQRVTYIERPPQCPPMELCRCHLEWQSDTILLVGWAHTLRVVSFNKANSSNDNTSSTTTAEVVSLITFDFFVAGISPWGTTAVCVLAYRPPGSVPGLTKQNSARLVEGEGEASEMPFPEVHIVSFDGKQVSADILHLRGYQRLRASDYHMPSLQYRHIMTSTDDRSSIYDAGFGRLQYLCTPKDVVICRLRDIDDRVEWALARKQYEKALTVALRDPTSLRKKQLTLAELMEYYLSDLIKRKDFKLAAEEIKRLFVGDEYAGLWEKYVYVFAQRGQLSLLAKFLPTAHPRLPTVQYEMVLKHFLDSDPGQLLEMIRKWPKPKQQTSLQRNSPEYTETAFVFEPLYDAQAWINQLETVVRRRRMAESDAISIETSYIMEALAELYTATEQQEHALRIYLSQGAFCTNKDHVFKLVQEYQLWSLVQTKVVNLFTIDRSSALSMLVHQTEQLKILEVVSQLEHEREWLYAYLHELCLYRFKEYNTEMYAHLHEQQVSLYAEYEPSYLLKFLQTSSFVPLEKAYTYCKEQTPPLWDAMIYILGRMGQPKRALDLILTQRSDIDQAIQFVEENDAALWEYLIDLSLTSTDHIQALLRYASQHKIDPIPLIRKLPEDMEIPGLKSMVMEIISNYRLQQTMCEGCTKVFETDRVQLLQRQVVAWKRARRVAPKKQCSICMELIRPPTCGKDNIHICIFECGHCYHLPCLEDKMRMWKRSSELLGCFRCDHTTRAYAQSTPTETIEIPRGITEDQLQRAKDITTLKMAA